MFKLAIACGMHSAAIMVDIEKHGILLRQIEDQKLSWEKTYKEMARENEDWQDLENTLLDGLDDFET